MKKFVNAIDDVLTEIMTLASQGVREITLLGQNVNDYQGRSHHGTLTDLFHGQLPRFPQEVATARARGERCLVVVSPAHRRRIEELLSTGQIDESFYWTAAENAA